MGTGYGQPTLYSAGPSIFPSKPVLKWAGGKSQLLAELVRAVPQQFNKYIEPFLGGGALLFRLARPDAIASDSNEDLMQFYGAVREHPRGVIAAVSAMPVSREFFYDLRSRAPESMDPVQRAARFLYLNKTCYNGLHRVNQKGEFNTPFGGRTNVRLVDVDNLHAVSRVLAQTQLHCTDYREVLDLAKPGDFVYLDPPYLPLGGYSDFRRYTPHFFGQDDHVQLAESFRCLAERGAMVLLSNSANPVVEELYAGFVIRRVKASRQINCRPEGRGQITELLIANYALDAPDAISSH